MSMIIHSWKNPDKFELPPFEFVKNPIGSGRRYMLVDQLPFREEAFSAFDLKEIFPEPLFKNFIGENYLDNAFVHEHMDPAPKNFVHVRANWMIQKPKIGGNPVINGKEININEGDLWLCFASEERHSSTPIFGGSRIVCSFGALIERTEYERYIK